MKNLFWIFILILLSPGIHSQEVPRSFTAPNGTVIILTGVPQSSGYFTIERSLVGKEVFEPWKIISQPGSEAEFKGLVLNYSQYFYPLTFDNRQLGLIWDEFLKSKKENKPGVYLLHPAMWLACGLACMDTAGKNGRLYEYRVSFINDGKTVWTKITKPEISSQKKMISYANSYKAITRERSILLEWHIPDRDKPSYFDVFRTETQKNNLQNILPDKGFYTEKDTLILVSKDSTVAPGEVYTYYFQTYDFWGNPAGKTQPVNLFAKNTTDVPYLSDFKSRAVKQGVRLHWMFSDLKNITSVTILRSSNYDTGFRKIVEVPSKDTAYTDQSTVPATNYYYQLKIRLVDGNTVSTTKVAGYSEITPLPEPPRHFKVISIKSGVTLTWQGREKWIAGYIVFRAPGCKGKMSQISPMIKPGENDTFSWTDQSPDLKGDKVYSYAARAFSPTMAASRFSDTICISPEIKVAAPMTPSHVKIRKEEKRAFITWDNLAPKEPLLSGYNIYRKTVSLYNPKNTEPAKKLNKDLLKFRENFFIDTTIKSGYRYEYTVEAVNFKDMKSGLSYPAFIEMTEPAPVSPAGIHLFNTNEGILIKWDGTSQEKLANYLVYRFEANGKPKVIYTAKADEFSFTDKTAKKDVLYFYYVTSTTTDGRESQPDATSSLRKE